MRLYLTCAQTGAAARWRSSAIHSAWVTCQAGSLDGAKAAYRFADSAVTTVHHSIS